MSIPFEIVKSPNFTEKHDKRKGGIPSPHFVEVCRRGFPLKDMLWMNFLKNWKKEL